MLSGSREAPITATARGRKRAVSACWAAASVVSSAAGSIVGSMPDPPDRSYPARHCRGHAAPAFTGAVVWYHGCPGSAGLRREPSWAPPRATLGSAATTAATTAAASEASFESLSEDASETASEAVTEALSGAASELSPKLREQPRPMRSGRGVDVPRRAPATRQLDDPGRPQEGPLVDQFGRTVRKLRISVTDRCNFRCVYCMPEDVEFMPAEEHLTFDEIERVVRILAPLGVSKLRLTGGEPLLRPNLPELVARLTAVPGIESV